jgi:hypothetical protein
VTASARATVGSWPCVSSSGRQSSSPSATRPRSRPGIACASDSRTCGGEAGRRTTPRVRTTSAWEWSAANSATAYMLTPRTPGGRACRRRCGGRRLFHPAMLPAGLDHVRNRRTLLIVVRPPLLIRQVSSQTITRWKYDQWVRTSRQVPIDFWTRVVERMEPWESSGPRNECAD